MSAIAESGHRLSRRITDRSSCFCGPPRGHGSQPGSTVCSRHQRSGTLDPKVSAANLEAIGGSTLKAVGHATRQSLVGRSSKAATSGRTTAVQRQFFETGDLTLTTLSRRSPASKAAVRRRPRAPIRQRSSLVYFDIGRQQEAPPLSQQCTATELQEFFEALCEGFIAWVDDELLHRENGPMRRALSPARGRAAADAATAVSSSPQRRNDRWRGRRRSCSSPGLAGPGCAGCPSASRRPRQFGRTAAAYRNPASSCRWGSC